MSPRVGAVIVMVVAAASPACAKRTEARTRSAWDRGARSGRSPGEATGTGAGAERRNRDRRVRHGWDRVGEVVEAAGELLTEGVDDRDVELLARRWCAEEAKPQSTRHGDVRVCIPAPPISVLGHPFTLELGAVGVIGLVASELSGAQSRRLLDEALARGRSWCAGSWTAVPAREDTNPEELHTCPVTSGSTLAVGRFARDAEADLWQVSVAVIGAG